MSVLYRDYFYVVILSYLLVLFWIFNMVGRFICTYIGVFCYKICWVFVEWIEMVVFVFLNSFVFLGNILKINGYV